MIRVLVIQAVTFWGWLSDPFEGLSDLQLGDKKVTLNHLGCVFLRFVLGGGFLNIFCCHPDPW